MRGVIALTAFLLVGVTLQSPPDWQFERVAQSFSESEARLVEFTADGSLWLGIRGEGLAHLVDGDVTLFGPGDGLVSDGVADLLEDSQGRLWAAGLGGYSVYEGGRWSGHAEVGGLRPRVVFSVHEEPGTGAIWLAANGGAVRLESGLEETLGVADGLPHQVVHAVLVDARGVRWFACRTGLARQDGEDLDVFFRETNFRSIVEAGGILWFGTSDGVLKWDGQVWKWYLEGKAVLPSLVASDGSIWGVSEAEGLFHLENDEWVGQPLPSDLASAIIHDVAQSPDGSLLLATSQGAVRMQLR